jgi:cytoskeletal protein RodZ
MIGDILLKEREKQKLSIQDIEQGTSIRAVYIDALEKGEYDKLPGEVYAKGFIKNYGNFLELNGEDLVRQFIAEITPVVTESETPQTENLKSESELVAKTKIAAKNISQTFQASVQNNSTEDSDSQKYIFAAVAGILLLIGGLFYGFSDSDSQPSEVVTVETQTVETQQVAPVEQPKPVPAVETVTVASTPTPQPVNDVNLQATFSDDCWTRVVVDGAMVYEGMINAGQTFDWKGNENINVLLGNAGAVQIMKNGQNVGSLGAAGDVVERTFTR